MIITEKDITKIVKFVINEISDTTAQFGWATKYAQEHYTKERIAFAEQCAEEIKNKIKDGEVSPTPQDVKLAVKKLFSEYEKMGNNSFIYDSLGYVVDLVMSDESVYRTYKQNSYKKMVLSKISKNEKTKTKSKILFDYFEKNGVSEKPKVIAQKFQEQGINITPNDVSVVKNRFLGLKFANNMLAKPIEIVREWFYSTGGNTIDKNDENYPQEICEKIGEYHDTAAYAIRGVKVMQLLMENDGSVFYDFIQMLRFYNGLKYSCDNIRLLYYVAMYFDKKVPKQITSLLSSSDIENYLKQISLSKGRSVTPTICTKYLKSWGFNPYEKITKNNCETLIQFLFEKFGSDNISFINGLINLGNDIPVG